MLAFLKPVILAVLIFVMQMPISRDVQNALLRLMYFLTTGKHAATQVYHAVPVRHTEFNGLAVTEYEFKE